MTKRRKSKSSAGVTTQSRLGKGVVGDFIAVYVQRTDANTDLKPASKVARLVALKKLTKTWPGIEGLKASQVTPAAVADWAARFKADGTRFTPPGASSVIKGNSSTSVNRAIDTLRRVLDIAVERGAIHANPVSVKPAEGRLKKKVTRTKLSLSSLPSVANLQRLFVAMENNGAPGGWGAEAADFCRFLAYSGARLAEAGAVTWACVNWERKEFHVQGVKSETSDWTLPLFGELESLLKRIIERRKKAAVFTESKKPTLEPTDRIFRLSECQKTIDRASKAVAIPRITHHDFRHLFATRCIESGVDIPTVSRWLGHSDGGALAMRTYGHLRQEHSATMAALGNRFIDSERREGNRRITAALQAKGYDSIAYNNENEPSDGIAKHGFCVLKPDQILIRAYEDFPANST